MTATVLLVLHADSTDTAMLEAVLAEQGNRVRFLRLYAGEQAPDAGVLAELAGLVVLGGAMGAYEAHRYPFLNTSMRLLDAAVAAALPTMAICLGAQLLARVAGGRAFPGNAGLEWGFVPIKLTAAGQGDPVLDGAGAEHFSFHSDSFDLPPGVEVLAESVSYPQAFRVGSALGLQFHPELSVHGMHQLLALAAGTAPDAEIDAARVQATARAAATRRGLAALLTRWAMRPTPVHDPHPPDLWRSG
ncbi:MAG: glutamine amidotransferase [Pseudonocardia sp.]|nr:glutamine amidotransferase [Pseudonocardia sp.]